MSDQVTIDAEQVRQEHEAEVGRTVQWTYLAGVLGGGFVLMLALIAVLAARS